MMQIVLDLLNSNLRSNRLVITLACSVGMSVSAMAQDETAAAATPAKKPPTTSPAASTKKPPKYKPIAEVTKDAEKIEGLFTLYRKDQHLYAEIKANQFNKPLLAPIAIARGMASAGTPLNFGDEWVIYFRRIGDNVHLVRKNIHYEAPKGSPLAKAVKQNYTDSVLMALPIVAAAGEKGPVLIDFADIFFKDFAGMGLGNIDRKRTSWHSVKAFKNNIELQVEATFQRGGSGFYFSFGEDGIVDRRGVTVVIHYSLTNLPEGGYKPRYADQRVGHFISATRDYGSKNPDTTFTRRINRWHLVKANPKAKLSPPKKQLVWWVEDNVPHEFRPYVEEGILEWNKAFEKIGFRNAIGVRWQNERDDFDPEDTNYCTFRWITTPFTFAMSGLRANPITGEMIDGDVIFDASWIRAWKDEYAYLMGVPAAAGATNAEVSEPQILGAGEIISPMMATKQGFGLPSRLITHRLNQRMAAGESVAELVPSSWSPLMVQLSKRLAPNKFTSCQYGFAKRHEFRLAALALAATKGDGKASPELPEEFLGQAIKEVVMHEVGHSLGLRHNFKASSIRTLEEINDPAITREKGMVGSVMDYNPLNIAGPGKKQGDYAATSIGPYDYWAIEYAYKPLEASKEKTGLKEIAARSPEGDLAYATDEDLYSSSDPLVNTYDLGNDPLEFGRQRMELAKGLLADLDDKVVRDGESWARLRSAFSMLLGQFGDAAYLATSTVGGQYISRDFKGGENGHDPVQPVPGEKQRAALAFIVKEILSDEAFKFSPEVLRRLTTEQWYHWGSDSMFFGGSDFSVYDRILSIQKIPLNSCLGSSVLRRVQNQHLLSEEGANPLKMSEIFRTLTDNVWAELKSADGRISCSTIRRNLQREHLSRLSKIVISGGGNSYSDSFGFVVFFGGSGSYPADARSLARMHLREIAGLIEVTSNKDMDDATRAHLEEAGIQITKVLDARFEATGP